MEAPLPMSEDSGLANADEMFAKRGCCCFWVSFPSSSAGTAERGELGGGSAPSSLGKRCWRRGAKALMKIREWTELVAGPRWKTFIRRFRRGRIVGGGRYSSRFGYDPLSYARNFDEHSGSEESDGDSARRGFSARYVVPPSARTSMDIGGREVAPLFHDKH